MAWTRIGINSLVNRRIVSSRFIHRSCSHSTLYPQIPLTQPLPDVDRPKYALTSVHKYEHQVTQLANGIKVITKPCFGQDVNVRCMSFKTVIVDAGSRYELPYPKGISHLFSKLAFQASRKFRNKEDFIDQLDKFGVTAQCEMHRDCGIYSISGFSHGVPNMLEAIADNVLYPDFSPGNVEQQKIAMQSELQYIVMMAESELILTEMIHKAAFGECNIGFSKLADETSSSQIDIPSLKRYHETLYSPNRTVVGGVGVDHQEFVKLVQKNFVDDAPDWFKASAKPVEDPAKYIGSSVILNLPKAPASPTMTEAMMPELSHAAFGLQGVSYSDPEFFSLAVLSILMGGGGSFSAGGPGKGMYSRIYRTVLCNYHWMYHCICLQHSYDDNGLFTIYASANPEQMEQLAEVVMTSICNMRNGFDKDEVSRAKRQLQSILLMNLESKQVLLEDLCRQTLSLPSYTPTQELCDKIERVTEKSLLKLVDRLLSSKLSVAAYGNLKHFPSHEQMQEAMMNYGRIKSQTRYSFYK